MINAVDAKALLALAKRHDPAGATRIAEALGQVATDAMQSPAGYNLIGYIDGLALAVHVDDRLVIGIKHGASKKPWKLERLAKDPLKNRTKMVAWANAKVRAKDAIVATVSRRRKRSA